MNEYNLILFGYLISVITLMPVLLLLRRIDGYTLDAADVGVAFLLGMFWPLIIVLISAEGIARLFNKIPLRK